MAGRISGVQVQRSPCRGDCGGEATLAQQHFCAQHIESHKDLIVRIVQPRAEFFGLGEIELRIFVTTPAPKYVGPIDEPSGDISLMPQRTEYREAAIDVRESLGITLLAGQAHRDSAMGIGELQLIAGDLGETATFVVLGYCQIIVPEYVSCTTKLEVRERDVAPEPALIVERHRALNVRKSAVRLMASNKESAERHERARFIATTLIVASIAEGLLEVCVSFVVESRLTKRRRQLDDPTNHQVLETLLSGQMYRFVGQADSLPILSCIAVASTQIQQRPDLLTDILGRTSAVEHLLKDRPRSRKLSDIVEQDAALKSNFIQPLLIAVLLVEHLG